MSTPVQEAPRADRATALAAALARLAGSPADLAAARRAAASEPDAAPALWPYSVPVAELGNRRWGDAVFYALTLFAVHQQSQSSSMNQSGVGVGEACARLRSAHHSSDAIDRRFSQAVSAEEPAVLAARMRGLVTMLRTYGIPLDYVRLAFDIQTWTIAEARRRTLSRWGRDYYRVNPTTSESNNQEAQA